VSAAADELAGVLFALDEPSLTTRAMTARITRAVVEWALANGWAPRTEARVDAGAAEQLGFVDVIVRRGGGEPHLAIEIDSTDKPWSVVKLRHAVAAGMDAIWIRWGDEVWAGAFDEVDVIQLQTLRRSAPRPRSDDQLSFWSRSF
jgi:hypothetical protein